MQYFDLSSIDGNLKDNVVGAQVYLHLPKAPSPDDLIAIVDVHKAEVYKHNEVSWPRELTVAAELKKHEGGWVKIDILKNFVDIWLDNPSENLGLAFEVRTKRGGVRIPVGVQTQQVKGNVSRFAFLQIQCTINFI